MYTSTFLTLLLAILTAANPVVKRDAVAVEANIDVITKDDKTLDTDITNFSNMNGTLEQALALNAEVTTIEALITKTINDVRNSGEFNEADGNVIFSEIETLEPAILDELSQIVNKKPGFDRIGVSPIALDDLKTLQSDVKAVENAIIAAAPSDLLPQATSIISAINAAFTSAIAAYS